MSRFLSRSLLLGRGTRPGLGVTPLKAWPDGLYLFHFTAAGALAGILADSKAFTIGGTITPILSDSLEGPFFLPPGHLEVSFTFFNLGDLCLDHITTASALAFVVGDGVAGAFFTAVANITFIPHFKG
jgi:hypothetical protein